MADAARKPRGFLILGAAAVAGMIAGLVAVYVGGLPGGNTVAAASCPASVQTAAALDPFAQGEVAAFQVAKEAQSFADLPFLAPDGTQTTLASLSGKTLLINLWATWCAPCREEMPALAQLEEELGGEDFNVVAINVDVRNEERARAFLEEIGVSNLPFYSDPTMGVFNTLKGSGLAFGLPTTLLVDENGCSLGVLAGPAEWASDDAKALVRAALKDA